MKKVIASFAALLAAGCSDESSSSDPPPASSPAPPLCSSHEEQVGGFAGDTFTFDNGDSITLDDNTNYHATFGGIAERGTYVWIANGASSVVSLTADGGSASSTVTLTFTAFENCKATAGNYVLQETGQSGTFTVSP